MRAGKRWMLRAVAHCSEGCCTKGGEKSRHPLSFLGILKIRKLFSYSAEYENSF